MCCVHNGGCSISTNKIGTREKKEANHRVCVCLRLHTANHIIAADSHEAAVHRRRIREIRTISVAPEYVRPHEIRSA